MQDPIVLIVIKLRELKAVSCKLSSGFEFQIIVSWGVLIGKEKKLQWCIFMPVKNLRKLQSAFLIVKWSQKAEGARYPLLCADAYCAKSCHQVECRALILQQFPCLRHKETSLLQNPFVVPVTLLALQQRCVVEMFKSWDRCSLLFGTSMAFMDLLKGAEMFSFTLI